MTTPNEDIHHMKSYLNLDERERANVQAEQDKYERRKAAMAYGAASAGVEPITFAPSYCHHCNVLLTRQNHDDFWCCSNCVFELHVRDIAEVARERRQSKRLAEAKAAGLIMMAYVLFLCFCAGLAAWGLAKGIDSAVWWLSNQ